MPELLGPVNTHRDRRSMFVVGSVVNNERIPMHTCEKCGKSKPPTAVVTVRMSAELHERLKATAHKQGVSLNQLCIERLEAYQRDVEGMEAK